MKYVLKVHELQTRPVARKVKVLDCSYSLTDSSRGRIQYEEEHIPGAIYLDLKHDLSDEISVHGGRHPLPGISKMEKTLGGKGITRQDTVVLYDRGDGAYAARGWWQLHYLGHENVYILDGGFKEWKKAKFSVEKGTRVARETVYIAQPQQQMLADVDDVRKVLFGKSEAILLDSRAQERYEGKVEPIDKKAGHIPTAVNFPWLNVLEEGLYKDTEELIQQFSSLPKDSNLIVYCGSGVTAIPNIIALKESGYTHVKLYSGSFSDWISYEENPVTKEQEKK
ncbi:sulfurtransferase [Bacillus sp. 2205SS5-2]|uniref:sulfurtransferase n=1 Tax=Bacillus sp. 2205SS5-2 TaxID=3109031 RepID=UPI003004B91A